MENDWIAQEVGTAARKAFRRGMWIGLVVGILIGLAAWFVSTVL